MSYLSYQWWVGVFYWPTVLGHSAIKSLLYCTGSTSLFTTMFQDQYSPFSLPLFGLRGALSHRKLPAATHVPTFATACKMKSQRCCLTWALSAKNREYTTNMMPIFCWIGPKYCQKFERLGCARARAKGGKQTQLLPKTKNLPMIF